MAPYLLLQVGGFCYKVSNAILRDSLRSFPHSIQASRCMPRKVVRVSSESPFATPVGQSPQKSFLQKNKKMLLIAGASVIILLLVFNLSGKSSSNGSGLDEVDVNGFTISAACEKVREEGWRVHEVQGTGDSSEKSDCTDNVRKVVRAQYVNHMDYVYLYFPNEPKPDDGKTSEETSAPTSEEAPAETSVEEASIVGAGSGYEAIYDEYSARLENECPNLTMDECAAISNEGVEKMAEYMYSASGEDGEYATYDSWARKLMGVYIASAQYA